MMRSLHSFLARRLFSLLFVGCWPWGLDGLAAAAGSGHLMQANRMILVEGRPRLLLGLYENPAQDADFQEAVRSGFNLFQSPADEASLDRVQRLGAKAWVNLGSALDLSEKSADRSAQLTRTVRQLAAHPALLLWEGPDEILWNQWYGPLETLRAEVRSMGEVGRGEPENEALARRCQRLLERGLYPEFEEARRAFWARVGRNPPHPGVRADTAPARVEQVGQGINAGIRLVRKLDPNHAIWLNHAPRNSLADLRHFNREVDMAGCDIYPAPANLDVEHSDLVDMGLSSVGAYTRRMREAAPGRACAMVLQGFGWRDLRQKVTEPQLALGVGRPPTFAESRFMAYDALVNGANAVMYWGTAYLKPWATDGPASPGRPRLWSDLMRLGRELRALEPVLVGAPVGRPSVRFGPTFGSHERPPLLVSLRRVEGDEVLLVVNESRHGLRFTVENLPGRLNGRQFHHLGTEESFKVTGGRLEDGIKPTDVHVYATSRRFEPMAP